MYYIGFKWWKTETNISNKTIDLPKCMEDYVENVCSKLYIREAYKDIYSQIMLHLEKKKLVIIVEGTPGVGKTFFLLYILFKFKSEGKALGVCIGSVYIILDKEKKYPRMCSRLALQDYLSDHTECIYLHDPFCKKGETPCQPILRAKGITVITTSADPTNVASVKHAPKHKIYMPVWSCEELIDCAKHCYRDITKVNVVKERFYYWGGSARNVFMTDDKELVVKFKGILKQVDSVTALISRIESTMNDSNPDRNFQWLRHMIVTEDYSAFHYDWPSIHIRRLVIMQLKEVEQTFLHRIELLASANYIKVGNLYEDYVITCLLKGPPRTLTAQSTLSTLNIPFPDKYVLFFNDVPVQAPSTSVLYIPAEKNKESIDMVIPPVMFQITTAKKHSKKEKGIQAIKKAFSTVEDWKFCWIIPQRNNSLYQKGEAYIMNFDYNEEVKYNNIRSELISEEDNYEDMETET